MLFKSSILIFHIWSSSNLAVFGKNWNNFLKSIKEFKKGLSIIILQNLEITKNEDNNIYPSIFLYWQSLKFFFQSFKKNLDNTTPTLSPFSASGNHQFVLYICESASFVLYSLVNCIFSFLNFFPDLCLLYFRKIISFSLYYLIFYFYTIFKGYFLFTLTTYWWYSLFCTISLSLTYIQ